MDTEKLFNDMVALSKMEIEAYAAFHSVFDASPDTLTEIPIDMDKSELEKIHSGKVC
jgi:hypothetical protein